MLTYQPNQNHHACYYSCVPVDIIVAECQEETSINDNRFVSSITVDGSSLHQNSIDDLFEVNNIERSYCASPTTSPLNMTISFSSPVLLTVIGIHGDQSNGFVNNFSLSFSEDGTNFNEYTRDTGSVVCCINNNYTYSMIGYQLL